MAQSNMSIWKHNFVFHQAHTLISSVSPMPLSPAMTSDYPTMPSVSVTSSLSILSTSPSIPEVSTIPFITISPLFTLLDIIIKTYFTKNFCLTIISEEPFPSLKSLEFIPILQLNVSIKATNLTDIILSSLDVGCSDYIVGMKNPGDFIDAFDEDIHVTNQRRGDRKMVFLPYEDSQQGKDSVLNVLSRYGTEFIPDILLIIPAVDVLNKDDMTYELGTNQYLGMTGNKDLMILDKWDSSTGLFEKNSTLFPDKLSNLKGRTVKIATFSYKPYSILEFDENDEIISMDGTEMRFGIEFCRWSNCTIEIIRDDVHEWGETWDNRSGNGILGNVLIDSADFGYGALYTWYHEYFFLDLSMPIVRTGITCIAPAPLLVASWLLPILPFNAALWGFVLMSLIIGGVTLRITSSPDPRPTVPPSRPMSITQAVLASVGIMVGQVPALYRPPPALLQVLNWLLFLTLMLSNLYSSGLASSITVPKYEPSIDTVQQLVDSQLDWGATHDAWIFSILEATEPNLVQLVSNFKKWPDSKLRSKGKTRTFAYSIERLPAGHFAIGDYVTDDAVPYLQLMQEDIYWEQCVIMARKSSPYTRRINKLIGRLHQSGLLHAWETQVVLKYSNYVVQLGVSLSAGRHGDGNDQPRPLGLEHLEGAFLLMGFGAAGATVALAGELCVGRTSRRRKARRLAFE